MSTENLIFNRLNLNDLKLVYKFYGIKALVFSIAVRYLNLPVASYIKIQSWYITGNNQKIIRKYIKQLVKKKNFEKLYVDCINYTLLCSKYYDTEKNYLAQYSALQMIMFLLQAKKHNVENTQDTKDDKTMAYALGVNLLVNREQAFNMAEKVLQASGVFVSPNQVHQATKFTPWNLVNNLTWKHYAAGGVGLAYFFGPAWLWWLISLIGIAVAAPILITILTYIKTILGYLYTGYGFITSVIAWGKSFFNKKPPDSPGGGTVQENVVQENVAQAQQLRELKESVEQLSQLHGQQQQELKNQMEQRILQNTQQFEIKLADQQMNIQELKSQLEASEALLDSKQIYETNVEIIQSAPNNLIENIPDLVAELPVTPNEVPLESVPVANETKINNVASDMLSQEGKEFVETDVAQARRVADSNIVSSSVIESLGLLSTKFMKIIIMMMTFSTIINMYEQSELVFETASQTVEASMQLDFVVPHTHQYNAFLYEQMQLLPGQQESMFIDVHEPLHSLAQSYNIRTGRMEFKVFQMAPEAQLRMVNRELSATWIQNIYLKNVEALQQAERMLKDPVFQQSVLQNESRLQEQSIANSLSEMIFGSVQLSPSQQYKIDLALDTVNTFGKWMIPVVAKSYFKTDLSPLQYASFLSVVNMGQDMFGYEPRTEVFKRIRGAESMGIKVVNMLSVLNKLGILDATLPSKMKQSILNGLSMPDGMKISSIGDWLRNMEQASPDDAWVNDQMARLQAMEFPSVPGTVTDEADLMARLGRLSAPSGASAIAQTLLRS